ncbi:MAG: hypothetical protein Q6363_007255 [Candidatus Njordarchaeota archaeon]
MYYEIIHASDELVGSEGFLRLPTYIFDEFVFDENRQEALDKALYALRNGKNVLIVGKAGAGKTAFLAVVLKKLMDSGYRIGKIINGEIVLKEHESNGIFLFYDDIPRMEQITLRSIIENRARMIISTARVEELDDLSKKIGMRPEDLFLVIEIREMSEENLRKILERFARREGIEIDPLAVNVVISKARNLPVYIWQVIRDLTIARKDRLDVDFANKIPEGMLEYVDRILWNVLGDKEDRREILLTLLIMTNMPEYEMHQDLFNAVFVEATKEIRGVEAPSRTIILGSDTLDKVCRYLARTPRYSFRLPHDSWADVLKGKSRGLLSREISGLVYIFPIDEQLRILRNAAKRAYDESISKSKDTDRIREFFRQLNLIGLGKEVIGEKVEAPPPIRRSISVEPVVQREAVQEAVVPRERVEEKIPTKPIEVKAGERISLKLYATSRRVKSYNVTSFSAPLKLSEISDAILSSGTYVSVCSLTKREALRRIMYRKMGRKWTIKYPCWGGLSITETIEIFGGKTEDEKLKDFFIWFFLAFVFLFIPFIGPLLFIMLFLGSIAQLFFQQGVYLSEIVIDGERDTVYRLVREIRAKIRRKPLQVPPHVAKRLQRRLGISITALEKQWYVI